MFAAPELRVELHGHPARSGRLVRSRNQAARPRPILQAQGTPRKPRLHGVVSTSRDLRNSAPADGRDSGRRRRHYFRGTLRSRRNSESRSNWFSDSASLGQQPVATGSGTMGVQSLHGGWFRNAGVRVGRRWLPVSARRKSVLRVRLDAAGSLDQFPGHKSRVGRSLSGAHEGRLAPVHQDSHYQNCGNCSRGNSIVRDVSKKTPWPK